ncbi:MAG TPA: sodium:proton antiporter [Gemmatimonadaceae bacterium]
MSVQATLVILFSVATAVAIGARRLRIPYTAALVVVGLALSALHIVQPPHLTKQVLFAFILPGLLFEAAYNLDMAELRRSWWGVTALAVPGVAVAILLTAWLTTTTFGALGIDPTFTIGVGLLFGAVIAATDPVAVVALFRQLRAPERLATLLEAESLLNDGTAIVFLSLILSVVSGAPAAPGALAWHLLTMTCGGILTGAAVGLAASQVTRRVDDPMIEITLTVIAAYGSFVLSDQIGVSGVLATVSSGMICGNYGKRVGMSDATKVAIHAFWEYLAFALNSVVFLLIGFEVAYGNLIGAWREVGIGYVAALMSRAAVIAAMTMLLRSSVERIPARWGVVLTWGGLRGALSMVLVLGLASDVAGGQLLVTMTFGVVLISLVAQGLSMPWLLRRLRIQGE